MWSIFKNKDLLYNHSIKENLGKSYTVRPIFNKHYLIPICKWLKFFCLSMFFREHLENNRIPYIKPGNTSGWTARQLMKILSLMKTAPASRKQLVINGMCALNFYYLYFLLTLFNKRWTFSVCYILWLTQGGILCLNLWFYRYIEVMDLGTVM